MQQFRPRIEQRTKVLIRARVRRAGAERDACILDISSRGMLLTMSLPPRPGDTIEIVGQGHVLAARVEWAHPRRFGVSFHERIDYKAYIAGDPGSIAMRGAFVRLSTTSHGAALAAERFPPRTRFALLAVAGAAAAALVGKLAGALILALLSL